MVYKALKIEKKDRHKLKKLLRKVDPTLNVINELVYLSTFLKIIAKHFNECRSTKKRLFMPIQASELLFLPF